MTDQEQQSVGAVAREQVDARGVKVTWLAEEVGLSSQHLSNCLAGRFRFARRFPWRRFADALRLTPAEQAALIAAGVAPEAFGRGPS